MSQTEAQKAAKTRYDKQKYKPLLLKMLPDENDIISQYCEQMKISKTRFVVRACLYFIGRGEIPPEN